MAEWEVELEDGRVVTVESDVQPSEADVVAALGDYSSDEPKGAFAALAGAGAIGEAPWYAKPVLPGHKSVLQAAEALPGVGGMIGGLVGSTAAGFGAVGGAALGGGAGESARQLFRRSIGASVPETSGEAAKDIAISGVTEGALEGVGLGMGRAFKAVAAPGREGLEAGVKAAAERQGIDLPASALTTSKPVHYIEAAASEGIGGGAVQRRASAAMEKIAQNADNLVKRASSLEGPSAQGKVIADGLVQFRRQWIQMKNRLYQHAEREMPNLTLQAESTVDLLRGIVEEKAAAGSILQGGPVADKTFYEGLLNGLTRVNKKTGERTLKNVSASEVRAVVKELNQKVKAAMADPFAAANQGLLKKVSATLDDDFRVALRNQAPDIATRLDIANEAYKEGISKINSTFGKSIHKAAQKGEYDKVLQGVIGSGMSADNIPRLLEVVGDEGTEAVRAGLLADLVARAKNPRGEFTPLGLSRAMKRYGEDKLTAILTPDQFAKLQDLATTTRAMEGLRKVVEGSPTAQKLQWSSLGGAASATFITGDFATPVAYVLGNAAFNKFVGSSFGQKWLTSGFTLLGKTGERALRQAPRAAATAHRMATVEE